MVITKPQSETKAQLPVSTSSKIFTIEDQKYQILRFPKGKGPNLAQTITIARGMKGKKMLTIREATKIDFFQESNFAFGAALKKNEWGYVRDQKEEKAGGATYLGCWPVYYPDRLSNPATMRTYHTVIINNEMPEFAAPIMILRINRIEKQTKMLRR